MHQNHVWYTMFEAEKSRGFIALARDNDSLLLFFLDSHTSISGHQAKI